MARHEANVLFHDLTTCARSPRAEPAPRGASVSWASLHSPLFEVLADATSGGNTLEDFMSKMQAIALAAPCTRRPALHAAASSVHAAASFVHAAASSLHAVTFTCWPLVSFRSPLPQPRPQSTARPWPTLNTGEPQGPPHFAASVPTFQSLTLMNNTVVYV